MSLLNKLMNVTTLGSSLANLAFFKRVLSRLVVLSILLIVISVMIVAWIIAGLYGLYFILVSNGILSPIAIGITVGVALLITFLIIGIAFDRMQEVKKSHQLLDTPIIENITSLIEAFAEGFKSRD